MVFGGISNGGSRLSLILLPFFQNLPQIGLPSLTPIYGFALCYCTLFYHFCGLFLGGLLFAEWKWKGVDLENIVGGWERMEKWREGKVVWIYCIREEPIFSQQNTMN